MKKILLSGGKGKRLWPLSTDNVPKQFVPIFENASSMLKKTYNCILKQEEKDNVYVATSEDYKDEILNEIKEFKNFIFEPSYIGTFGAILNIAVYLNEVEKISQDEIISIIPIDHDVDDNFYNCLLEAENMIKQNNCDICLIGIKPTFPSNQYGYILNSNNYVLSFKEKPNTEKAIKYIENNALWNSGIVNFKLKVVLDIARKYLKYSSYQDFINQYDSLPHQSFDVEVLEKTNNLMVVSCDSRWNDLGTWEILSSKISKPDSYNTNIINFENKKIINDGIKNSIVVNTCNGIRLMKKNDDCVFRQWGFYEVLNNFDKGLMHIKIKKLTIFDGKNISYQFHEKRSEEWFILEGNGEIIIDGEYKKITAGDIVKVNKSSKHSIRALTTLNIIEIQYGDSEIEDNDIVRIEYEWDKILKEHLNKCP